MLLPLQFIVSRVTACPVNHRLTEKPLPDRLCFSGELPVFHVNGLILHFHMMKLAYFSCGISIFPDTHESFFRIFMWDLQTVFFTWKKGWNYHVKIAIHIFHMKNMDILLCENCSSDIPHEKSRKRIMWKTHSDELTWKEGESGHVDKQLCKMHIKKAGENGSDRKKTSH